MVPTSHAPPQVAPSADRRILCVCGIRPIPNSLQNQVWIRSPKTGRELVIGDGWFAELRAVAPRVIRSIVHARANGQSRVEFSLSELKCFADLVAQIAEQCRPKPGLYAGYRVKPGRRRGWINR